MNEDRVQDYSHDGFFMANHRSNMDPYPCLWGPRYVALEISILQ
jgi:hypothetical protein